MFIFYIFYKVLSIQTALENIIYYEDLLFLGYIIFKI